MTEQIETRTIVLPRGGTMNVDVTERFYDRVRRHFDLSEGSYVSDDHIRMYIYGAVKSAVDKHVKDDSVFG